MWIDLSVAMSTISGCASASDNDLHHNIKSRRSFPANLHLAYTTFVAQGIRFEDSSLSILIITNIAYGFLSEVARRSAGRSPKDKTSTNSRESSTRAILIVGAQKEHSKA